MIIHLKFDARLDQKNFSKKEMNYSLIMKNPINLNLSYNETQIRSI